jgi:hypothetical protein
VIWGIIEVMCKKKDLESDAIMTKWKRMIDQIGRYLKSVSKELMVVNVEGGHMGNWERTIAKIQDQGRRQDIEHMVVCVSALETMELIRWVKYNVEFRIDNRASGGVGATGRKEDIEKVVSLLH